MTVLDGQVCFSHETNLQEKPAKSQVCAKFIYLAVEMLAKLILL
jgi:hypothetical protein